jgi:hypothetical protein
MVWSKSVWTEFLLWYLMSHCNGTFLSTCGQILVNVGDITHANPLSQMYTCPDMFLHVRNQQDLNAAIQSDTIITHEE